MGIKEWWSYRYSEKHISYHFRFLGYIWLIGSFISFLAAADKESNIMERMYWFLGAPYLLIMGVGIILRKDLGRKLLRVFPFYVIILIFIVSVIVSLKDISLLIVTLIAFPLILCIPSIAAYFLWFKYCNHPNVKKYFNR